MKKQKKRASSKPAESGQAANGFLDMKKIHEAAKTKSPAAKTQIVKELLESGHSEETINSLIEGEHRRA